MMALALVLTTATVSATTTHVGEGGALQQLPRTMEIVMGQAQAPAGAPFDLRELAASAAEAAPAQTPAPGTDADAKAPRGTEAAPEVEVETASDTGTDPDTEAGAPIEAEPETDTGGDTEAEAAPAAVAATDPNATASNAEEPNSPEIVVEEADGEETIVHPEADEPRVNPEPPLAAEESEKLKQLEAVSALAPPTFGEIADKLAVHTPTREAEQAREDKQEEQEAKKDEERRRNEERRQQASLGDKLREAAQRIIFPNRYEYQDVVEHQDHEEHGSRSFWSAARDFFAGWHSERSPASRRARASFMQGVGRGLSQRLPPHRWWGNLTDAADAVLHPARTVRAVGARMGRVARRFVQEADFCRSREVPAFERGALCATAAAGGAFVELTRPTAASIEEWAEWAVEPVGSAGEKERRFLVSELMKLENQPRLWRELESRGVRFYATAERPAHDFFLPEWAAGFWRSYIVIHVSDERIEEGRRRSVPIDLVGHEIGHEIDFHGLRLSARERRLHLPHSFRDPFRQAQRKDMHKVRDYARSAPFEAFADAFRDWMSNPSRYARAPSVKSQTHDIFDALVDGDHREGMWFRDRHGRLTEEWTDLNDDGVAERLRFAYDDQGKQLGYQVQYARDGADGYHASRELRWYASDGELLKREVHGFNHARQQVRVRTFYGDSADLSLRGFGYPDEDLTVSLEPGT